MPQKPGLLLVVLIAFYSCQKSNNPTPDPPGKDTVLSSMTVYIPADKRKIVENFTYDPDQRLVTIHGFTFDSTSYPEPHLDSTILKFLLGSPQTVYPGYDVTYYLQGDPPGGITDHHLLYYDAQNRVILDSITIGSAYPSSQHFIYDQNGHTTIQWFSPDPNAAGGYAIIEIDTMTVQAENLADNISYTVLNGIDGSGQYNMLQQDFVGLDTYTYSAFANPLYAPALSKSLGALLVFNSGADYLSKNLASQHVMNVGNGSQSTLNFSWITDSAGKVVRGQTTDGGTGAVDEQFTFNYAVR